MLVNLHVKNFAIIDEVWLDFGPGFNVLSGETGAGKSILIGSLSAVLGGKISKELLGSRADYALVELTFEADNPGIRKIIEENDLVIEDGLVVVSRRISENGRSVCRINGETVSAAVLKQVAEVLIDIHGQHEHQSLLYRSGQRNLVDNYSEKGAAALGKLRDAYHAYKKAKTAYEEAKGSGRKSERELELLQYERDEIKGAALKDGEDTELEERFRVLSNTEKILEEIAAAREALSLGASPAGESIDAAVRSVGKAAQMDAGLSDVEESLGLISEQLSEISARLSEYAEDISGSEEEYAEVGERLDVINKLKSKYGGSLESIKKYAEECEKKLAEYSDYDAYLAGLKKELEVKEELLSAAEKVLYDERKKSAKVMQAGIEKALSELNFEHAKFEIRLEKTEDHSEYGDSDIEFYLSANLGEPMRKLSQVASGGELSRIMLAIKSVVAGKNETDALVFDEIDTGISGRTAQKVAEKIALLSSEHQVICITHLPQIAAMADTHFLIEKTQSDGRTSTGITKLTHDKITGELARMLGGVSITESVLKSAEEMKQLADETKKYILRS